MGAAATSTMAAAGAAEHVLLPQHEPAKAPWTPRRIDMPHIQGLRLMAMVWIIAYHYLGHAPGSPLETFVNHRPLDLFTVISGFASHLAYGRRPTLGGPVAFLARRSSKVLFMYFLTLVLATALRLVQMASPISDVPGTQRDYLRLLASFLMALAGINVWVFPLALMLTADGWQCWPPNGPLWFVQSLIFCWFVYPLLRDRMCGEGWTRYRVLALMVALGVLGIGMPALLRWAVPYDQMWLVIKVCPVFMLPAFFLGVAACELYLLELEHSENLAGADGTEDSCWAATKRDWAGVLGELKLILFICVQLEQYPSAQRHTFSLLFGSILYLLAVAAAHSSTHAYALGVRWLLGLGWVVSLGDASLCAFTLQEPVSVALYWMADGGAHLTDHMPFSWMPAPLFVAYISLLYAIAVPVGLYVNTPASVWIQHQLMAAFPSIPRPSSPPPPPPPVIASLTDALPTR